MLRCAVLARRPRQLCSAPCGYGRNCFRPAPRFRTPKGSAMPDTIQLTIDGKAVSVPPGTTILQAARSIGIDIPTICYHEYCTANGLCRICVWEVGGARTLAPSCVAQVSEGINVLTSSQRVLRARRTILEMLAASVDLSEA